MRARVVITTAGRPDENTMKLADVAQQALGYKQVPRNKRSVQKIMDTYDADVLVAGKMRYEMFRRGMTQPLFFHPDTAAFRLKRMIKGEQDPLVAACNLTKGDSFLDCTLGLSTDSIVASFVVGQTGRVVGVEADPDVAFITRTGLATFEPKFQELQESMRRIQVVHESAIAYLKKIPDSSSDVVYLDPMFTQVIEESTSFAPLRKAGLHGGLTEDWIEEAKRVAKRRVILKAHFSDSVFSDFGFHQLVRPNTKFHFGYIEK